MMMVVACNGGYRDYSMKAQSQQNHDNTRHDDIVIRHQKTGTAAVCLGGEEGGRALEQTGVMKAQLVVARNGGHRGWRHEGAVTVPTKEERESASVVVAGSGGHWAAAGCMRTTDST